MNDSLKSLLTVRVRFTAALRTEFGSETRKRKSPSNLDLAIRRCTSDSVFQADSVSADVKRCRNAGP